MDLKRCGSNNINNKNNNNSLAYLFVVTIVATLLTFTSFTINSLLVLATGDAEDENENRNADNGISNNDNHNPLSSLTSLQIPSSQQQNLDPDIRDSGTRDSNTDPSTQSAIQEQESVPLTEGTTPAVTTNAACGQVASGVVELTSDLNCSGDGIIINGPNTVINLNGYSLMGPGKDSSKVGIMVSNADNVVVNGPGSISNFQAGVLLSGANEFKLSSAIIENNQIAIFMTGADNTQILQNMINNNHLGIASHSSSGSKITSNLMSSNQLAGITFVNTKGSNMDMNNIHGSQDGVFLDAQSSQNTISANNVLENIIDINNANGLPININFNQYAENNCGVSNPSGLCIGR
jgi:parallel beta-helix repeat protein